MALTVRLTSFATNMVPAGDIWTPSSIIDSVELWVFWISVIFFGSYAHQLRRVDSHPLRRSTMGRWLSLHTLSMPRVPKGITMMLNFTPSGMGITNLLDMNAFLALEIRVILLFGVSFLLPVVLVLLNLVHVLSSAQLKSARKWSIFGFFCLGAFVNPSGDPISMCALAIPLSVMYVIAEWICRSNERKRSTDDMGIDKSEFDIQID